MRRHSSSKRKANSGAFDAAQCRHRVRSVSIVRDKGNIAVDGAKVAVLPRERGDIQQQQFPQESKGMPTRKTSPTA